MVVIFHKLKRNRKSADC